MLDASQLRTCIKYALVFSFFQTIGLCAIPNLPSGIAVKILSPEMMATFTIYRAPKKVCEALAEYPNGYFWASESFSTAALLEYARAERVIVFGSGSHHGRQDDILTDMKSLDGKDMLLIRRDKPHLEKYQACFARVEIKSLTIDQAPFYLVLGRDFRYQTYRQIFLQAAWNRYYQVPAWLQCRPTILGEKYGFLRRQEG